VEYVDLGRTGQRVSRICLGCLSFGDEAPWMLDTQAADQIIKKAIDIGITFFDTADVYSQGKSEIILGKALAGRRSDVVIATKVGSQFGPDPQNVGLSRSRIISQASSSMKRLHTNYIDLYQIHRWDYSTPIDETLFALTILVRERKVNHIGASSMLSWQFLQSLWTADRKGYESFISMQNRYNLAYREEEREMIPLCKEYGIAIIPYSPLGRGFLAGAYKKGRASRRVRFRTDKYFKGAYFYENDFEILDRVKQVAREKGVKPAQVALAWHFSKPWVISPILGATKVEHVEEAAEALDVKLSRDDIQRLEEVYMPHHLHGPLKPPG